MSTRPLCAVPARYRRANPADGPVRPAPPIVVRVTTLGLNGFAGADHEASAAVVVGDRLVAAVEEERLNRRRHSPGDSPLRAVVEALDVAGVDAGEVDAVCHGWRPAALGLGLDERSEAERIRAALASVGVRLRPAVPITFLDHHLAHFWSAVPFIPAGVDRTAVDGLVLDGAGESTAGAYFRWRRGELEKVWNLGVAGSLGLLYEAATAAVGMGPGDEGKTMGLASYGRPETRSVVAPPADDRFPGPIPALRDRAEIRRRHRANVARLRAIVPAAASFNRRADVALGVQSVVEARIMDYLRETAAPAPTLVMAGGVALNCTINTVVADWCAGRGGTLTIPPPANDAGISIGAAVAVSADPMACSSPDGAFLGRSWDPAEVVSRLKSLGLTVVDSDPDEVAAAIVDEDRYCGFFADRSEVGPRSLGRRAVLTRPDSIRTRDRLNVLKGRESWRPLAPSMLRADFDRSFRGLPSPYMLLANEARPEAMRPLAGVIHVDGTARPQVVADDAPGLFADLLRSVRGRTGRGVLVCTSFNPAGDPIVHTPEEAYAAAVRMGLDLLAGDGWQVDLSRR